MTNEQIREAIKEIVRIKSLQEREKELRGKILKELKKRRKEKLQLGGDDFIKVKEVIIKEYRSFNIFMETSGINLIAASLEKYHPMDLMAAFKNFCNYVTVVKKAIRNKFGENYFDHIEHSNERSYKQLSYKISFDEKNSVRGIDL